ncbi:hypothetical protein EGR_03216 [Echinococcus granulosus]|uniref:Uncharacterized protein n=1 Tax=Echinococcus granulosus TaxID=6210 RepID=W6ULN0_ECHGR|nr:hypothetical protein EGR_03216 [Echinococcus granulosus]EUB61943.1 hypothetical protein EGR_03216 [Echinococcus granulosus]
MSKIRHISLEQTPSPPERLPRLVLPPATAVSIHGSPSRRHRMRESHDFNRLSPQRPLSVRRISEDITMPTTTRIRYPSEEMSHSLQHRPLRPTSQPYHQLYEQGSAHADTSIDGWRPRVTNLPSVTSGVAVKDFYEENWVSSEEGEAKKRFHLREYGQNRRQRSHSKALSTSELDENSVSQWEINEKVAISCLAVSAREVVVPYNNHLLSSEPTPSSASTAKLIRGNVQLPGLVSPFQEYAEIEP